MLDELRKRGIRFEVIFNGEELRPEEDGYLGREKIGLGQFEFRCLIQKREELMPFCFNVDGKKNINLMKDRSEDNSIVIFSKKIPIIRNNFNILITRYPENNLRILIPEKDGKFEIWEAAIVSQDGLFFLTTQMTYEAKCFKGEGGEVICPRFERETKWPQLMEIVKPIFEGVELSPISEYIAPSPLKAEGLAKNQGRVVWWSLSQGLGAILLDKEGILARVHWRGIQPNPKGGRLRALKSGQRVSYQKAVFLTPTGAKPTSFPLEVKGVTPLE
jgi:cold shock CspA family protein